MVSFQALSASNPSQLKKQWPYFLLAFVLPVLAILWWWGLFASVSAQETVSPAYRYAYLESQGAYTRIITRRGEVEGVLRQQQAVLKTSITVIYDDPRTTDEDKRQARTGFLINDTLVPREPVLTDTIPSRRVVSVSVKAHPVFAYGKAYSALLEYAEQQGIALHLPTVELYDNSMLTVQMPLENHP